MVQQWSRIAKRLSKIQYGLGATQLSSDITELTLWMKRNNQDGQIGCRKFWKEYLPRIQFHNPELLISVKFIDTIDIYNTAPKEPVLHIHKTSGLIVVNVLHKRSDEICHTLLKHASINNDDIEKNIENNTPD
ncbi:hypothetical protein PCANB_000925 [Pneumocystis canis]|nr:hypothetical protein PCANB_000925 [Pneumocystis canis]